MFIATEASATLTAFTNRTAFENAIVGLGGTVSNETFNSFTSDTSFLGTPLDVGAFSLFSSEANTGVDDLIDVSPFGGVSASDRNLDGTPYVQGDVNTKGGGTDIFNIVFDAPIFAFGTEFQSIGGTGSGEGIEILGEFFEFSSRPAFFGVVGTIGETFVQIDIVGDDAVFGLDNFAFASAVTDVPEPTTLALFGLGPAGLGFMRRRRAA